jgi:tetratricopeptide (TPR) repeat protein
LIIALWLICISHSVGYSTSKSLRFNSFLQLADSLYIIKDYSRAALSYERCAFLAENQTQLCEVMLKKGKCYWRTEEYNDALRALQRINTFSISDSLAFETQFAIATTAYMQKDFVYAKSELKQIEIFTTNKNQVLQSQYLSVLTLTELHEWNEAFIKANAWIDNLDAEDTTKTKLKLAIVDIFDKKNIPKIKDPERANTLSTFVPGLGQLYAGYFWEGAANVSLQVLGFAIVGVGIYTKYYITGVVSGMTIFQRFYTGGIKRAEFLAKKKNYIEMTEFRSQLKPILIKHELEK